jgi:hypothetical protein
MPLAKTREGGISREHEKNVKAAPTPKEGRYLIAHAHEGTMRSGSPPLIGCPWASAVRSPPLLEALALLLHRILPECDIFVTH